MRGRPILGLAVAITILPLIVGSAPPLLAAKAYTMVGKIAAIDLDYKTVVIDVPLSGGKIFKVGGPLADNAVLKKGNKLASLSDFSVGEKVWVKWRSYEKGHLIEMMKSK